MRICVFNEDEAYRIEREGFIPDHRRHFHFTAKQAMDALIAGRVKAVWRNGFAVPDAVILRPTEGEDRTRGIDWRPRISEGFRVYQRITIPKR